MAKAECRELRPASGSSGPDSGQRPSANTSASVRYVKGLGSAMVTNYYPRVVIYQTRRSPHSIFRSGRDA